MIMYTPIPRIPLFVYSITSPFYFISPSTKPDVRQISEPLIIVKAIAYHKLIRNHKAHVVYIYIINHTALRLVQKCTDCETLRVSFGKEL